MRRISTLLPISVMRRISTVLTPFWHANFWKSRSCGGSPQYLLPYGTQIFGNPGHAEDLHTFLPILVMRRISTVLAPFWQILQIPVMRRISTVLAPFWQILEIPVMRRISTVLAPFWQILPIPVMRRISTL